MEIVATKTCDPSFVKTPQHLGIQSPIVECLRNRKTLIDAAPGLESSIHHFGLPFHEREPTLSMRAFPFVKQVTTVNLRPRIGAGFVRTERAGNSRQHYLRRAEINRIFPARNPDEILETARFAISCFATEENAVIARIAKRKSGAAASVLRGQNQLRVPWCR